MNVRTWVLIQALLVSAVSVSAAPLCGEERTTVDMARCLTAEVAAADKKLANYLATARARMDAQLLEEKVDLVAAQSAWLQYRDQQCGDVYQLWARGTIRYEKAARCQLDLTRERTHDVWSSYLTYVDSTPPVLPEP